MKRKLLNFLGLFVSIAVLSLSTYSLATKQYQHTVVKESLSEISSESEVLEDEAGGVVGVSMENVSNNSSVGRGITPEPPLSQISEADEEIAGENETTETEFDQSDSQQDGGGESSEEKNIHVSLAIDYGDGEVDNFDSEIEAGTTVYDYLKSMAFVEGSAYSYGVFVESINGVGSDADAGRYWLYEVDGSKPNVGADRYKLSDGDNVRWIYTKI